MFGYRTRVLSGLAFLAAAGGLAVNAQAQLFPGINPCQTCGTPLAAIPAPIVTTASVCDCPCMRPVTETVYQDVQHVEYRPEPKTVKVAKTITVMEDRPVTTYQQVTEARTVEVPSYINQTVTECQACTVNRSYWRTNWQPVAKFSPCQYDSRPGLLGEFNRMGYALRNSLTPNYVARREFVPNVVAMQVPVQRTVQIPTSRQVTYNVAKLVPVQTTQQVAVQKVVWEDQTVTAMVPFTTTRRVAVGTRTRMAYVDPYGGGTASASAEPTPTTAHGNHGQQSAGGTKGTTKFQSSPTDQPPVQFPQHRSSQPQSVEEPVPTPAAERPFAAVPARDNSVIRTAGWRSTRQLPSDEASELHVVQN